MIGKGCGRGGLVSVVPWKVEVSSLGRREEMVLRLESRVEMLRRYLLARMMEVRIELLKLLLLGARGKLTAELGHGIRD